MNTTSRLRNEETLRVGKTKNNTRVSEQETLNTKPGSQSRRQVQHHTKVSERETLNTTLRSLGDTEHNTNVSEQEN